LERKARVVTDWTLELFFRRDIVRIDIARSTGISRAHFEEGEIIFREGELARNFYTILDGTVQVVRQEEGQERLVATLRPGEFFGEVAILRGVRRTASVRALTPTKLLVMNGADFQTLASSTTYFGETLAEVMRQRLLVSDGADPPGTGDATTSRPDPL
jgi:CRP-like cAMP-binding protein